MPPYLQYNIGLGQNLVYIYALSECSIKVRGPNRGNTVITC